MKAAPAILCALVLAAGCEKPEPPKPPKPPPPPPAPPSAPPLPKDVRHDFTKPYLTEGRVMKLLKSMEEDRNPLDHLFGGGEPPGFSEITERLAEYNGFARKYGFQDYEEYCAVWGRVNVCESALALHDVAREEIENALREERKPDLPPEKRESSREVIASLREQERKSREKLNPQDLEIVLKYRSQIDAARKKLKK